MKSRLLALTLFAFALFPAALSHAQDRAPADHDPIRIQLKSAQEARLNSSMNGQISKISFKDGEHFKKGQTLVTFECSTQNAQLKQAKARVTRQSQLVKSSQKLFDLGSSSQTELNVLKAELSEAKAAADFAKAEVNKCSVKAPFSGLVSALAVKDFFSVREGEPLIELVGDGALEIEMIVPSIWMKWLKPDTIFSVKIDEMGQSYESRITRLGGKVDPITQSVKAYAVLDQKSHGLLPGMSGVAVFGDQIETNEASDHVQPHN